MSKMDDLEKRLINEPIMKNPYVGLNWYQWRIGGFGIPTGAMLLRSLLKK